MSSLRKILTRILAILGMAILILLAFAWQRDIGIEVLKTQYADARTSRFVHVMGMDVHYRDEGPQTDSVPLLLIHGMSSSLHTWDSLVARIGGRKRCIRLDLPAFGLTGPHPANDYRIEAYVHFLDSFLTRLGIEQCIPAGNSLGGGIAWRYAMTHPSKTAGLVLINASGYPRRDEKGSIGFKLAGTAVVGDLLTRLTPKALIRKSLENSYHQPERISEKLVTRYHDLILREGNRKATVALFKSRINPDTSMIATIQTPTLIIWGRHDQLISVNNAARFHRDIAGSKVLIIEDAGHVPMEETPGPVAAAIDAFLRKN